MPLHKPGLCNSLDRSFLNILSLLLPLDASLAERPCHHSSSDYLISFVDTCLKRGRLYSYTGTSVTKFLTLLGQTFVREFIWVDLKTTFREVDHSYFSVCDSWTLDCAYSVPVTTQSIPFESTLLKDGTYLNNDGYS